MERESKLQQILYRRPRAESTQRWLARQVGVREEQVSRWVHGRCTPSLSTQRRVARLLANGFDDVEALRRELFPSADSTGRP